MGVPAEVLECYDGDTCTMRLDLGLGISKVERIRFCDIDTPEIRGGGEAALRAKHTTMMLLNSAEVLEVNPSGGLYSPHRSFNRLLAWVVVDGNDAGELLLKGGLATKAKKRCRRY